MNQGLNPGPHLRIAALGVIVVGIALVIWYGGGAAPQPTTANEKAIEGPPQLQSSPISTPRPTLRPIIAAHSTPTPRPTKLIPTTTPSPAPVVHPVESGEMLLAIAAEYGTTVEEIMAVNHLTDPTTLQIGQKLLIPVTATPSPTPAPKTTPPPTPALVFETIQEGDTLLALSLKFDIPVDLLLMVNPMLDPNNLQIGQKVLIPPANGDLPDPVVWAPQIDYSVESGDTLLDIALANGSSLEDILAVNTGLEPDTLLQIGQTLKVPLTRPRPRPASVENAIASTNRPPVPTLSDADVAALKSGSPTLVGLEGEMVKAVNAERAAYDLPPYRVDPQLTTMAWGQAHDMVKRGYFSHITPEGRTLRDRFRERNMPTNWVGENIYLSVQPANQAVQATIGWFMGDAPHRRNILHPNFNRLGVGVAQGESGWYTFVLVFAGD